MTEAIAKRLEMLEEDLAMLKGAKHIAKIKGLWKGVTFTERDIEESKRALFRK